MSQLARWVQGIHMNCSKCGKVQQGMIIITTEDVYGLMIALHIECVACKNVMMRWPDDNGEKR